MTRSGKNYQIQRISPDRFALTLNNDLGQFTHVFAPGELLGLRNDIEDAVGLVPRIRPLGTHHETHHSGGHE